MIGNPRCPICGLYELNDGSEETLYTCECEEMDLVAEGLHACQTGDCPHTTQAECDAELKLYSEKESNNKGEK